MTNKTFFYISSLLVVPTVFALFFTVRLLVLLCHKFRRCEDGGIDAWQRGHRARRWARAMVRLAIEFGMWRSGRSVGATWSVTGGNGRFFEQPGGTRS
jgi:hypothetical protein